ncbi:MAG: hypothetical protein D6746_00120 [Bacteroidetes bacterium]|nr:MAG: hypothetical protein D6746_00120 [Bacteroidota bacterium]
MRLCAEGLPRWGAGLLLGALLLAVPPAVAQSLFGEADGPAQAFTIGYVGVDFTYNGDARPEPTFEFEGPVVGVRFARPGFVAALAYGAHTQDGADRRLLDVTLMLWGEWQPFALATQSRARFFVPVVLHSGYRRVSRPGADDDLLEAFEFSVLGLGTGGGFRYAGARVGIEARATPAVGLALRSFGEGTGLSTFVEADVQVHVARVAGRLGLSAGVGYRLQTWNGGGSGFLAGDFFDYRGEQRSFRLGVNW